MDNVIFPIRSYPTIVISDDAGGAIVILTSGDYMYAQRKSVAGKLLWNTLNQPASLFNGPSVSPTDAQKDRFGGAYIAFTSAIDNKQTDLYLQRIDSNGNKLFGGNGIKINPVNLPICNRAKLTVGKNGVTVTWAGANASTINNPQLYIQRFSPNGIALWPQPLLVSTNPADRNAQVVATDGDDGTFIAFTDMRNLRQLPDSLGGYYTNYDLYMQYFDSLGHRVWGNTDSVLSNLPGDQFTFQDAYSEKTMIPDGAGGFEIIYYSDNHLFAQRVNRMGQKAWPLDLNIGNNDQTKNGIQAMSDGNGGLVAAWLTIMPRDPFLYMQRVTAGGTLPWGAAPKIVNSPGDQQQGIPSPPVMAIDNDGNYVFCWVNSGTDSNYSWIADELKAQKVDSAGIKNWKPDGIIIQTIPHDNNSMIAFPGLLASTESKMMPIWYNVSTVYPNGSIHSAMLNTGGTLYDNMVRLSKTIKDGDWNDPTIWADGKVPAPGATITIKTAVRVSQHIICKSIQLESPGSVTVQTGFTITITG